jgi:hypothetical protein
LVVSGSRICEEPMTIKTKGAVLLARVAFVKEEFGEDG